MTFVNHVLNQQQKQFFVMVVMWERQVTYNLQQVLNQIYSNKLSNECYAQTGTDQSNPATDKISMAISYFMRRLCQSLQSYKFSAIVHRGDPLLRFSGCFADRQHILNTIYNNLAKFKQS